MVDPVTIGHGCNKWLKDDDTTFMTLSYVNGDSNAWKSCLDETQASYQVPAGYKFIILCFSHQAANTNEAELYITRHNVLDSSGGVELTKWWTSGDALFNSGKVDCWLEVPAGDYLNVRANAMVIFSGILTTV